MAKTALIIGATGAVGRHILQNLLLNPEYSRVHEVGRRVTALDKLPTHSPEKLVQHGSFNFDELLGDQAASSHSAELLKDLRADAVFLSLGSTRKDAGSADNFVKFDQDYVIAAAKFARISDEQSGIGSTPQWVTYVSSIGANSSSSFLYTKSKGQTEERLAKEGYPEVTIFRPGILTQTNRSETRILESILSFCVDQVIATFSKYTSAGIPCSMLGKAIVQSSLISVSDLKASKLATHMSKHFKDDQNTHIGIIGNSDARRLAQS